MRGPIAYGLSWPMRVRSGAAALDFEKMSALTFESFDAGDHRLRYPGLSLSWQVLNAKPGTPAVLNAANEVGVESFLTGKIRFDQIHTVNAETLQRLEFVPPQSLEALIDIDERARVAATAVVHRLA
jgi:1-deoxy-D-xylulose-5-phosphate reductoisomerase